MCLAVRLLSAVGRYAAEIHRSRRTARESSAVEPSPSSQEWWLCAARYLENVATAYIVLSVSSSVEIRKTIYCEEREEESVASPLFLLLWISASLWKSF